MTLIGEEISATEGRPRDVFEVNGGAISRKQICVALLTAEAEYIGISSAGQEVDSSLS